MGVLVETHETVLIRYQKFLYVSVSYEDGDTVQYFQVIYSLYIEVDGWIT